MKKNKAMRAAGGLFVATMLTTSIISGTYAKYVYSGSSSQTARVAAFGATLTATGQLFDTTYLEAPNNTPAGTTSTGISVRSLNTDKLVAPGTKSSDDGLVISFSGKPEVSCKISFSVTANSTKDIFLKAHTWTDMTKDVPASLDSYNGAELEDDYYPVKFTLSKKLGTGDYAVVSNCRNVTLQTIATYLNGNSSDVTYDVSDSAYYNKDLSEVVGSYKLTWAWDFETQTDAKGNEIASPNTWDTILGDLVTGTSTKNTVKYNNSDTWDTPTAGTDYSTDVAIEFTATIEQID